jgi:hypothetical protein
MVDDVVKLHVRKDGGSERILKGRVAWMLAELLRAGERGVTPIERPAPRMSDYALKLRGQGIVVKAIDERHGGARHG